VQLVERATTFTLPEAGTTLSLIVLYRHKTL